MSLSYHLASLMVGYLSTQVMVDLFEITGWIVTFETIHHNISTKHFSIFSLEDERGPLTSWLNIEKYRYMYVQSTKGKNRLTKLKKHRLTITKLGGD